MSEDYFVPPPPRLSPELPRWYQVAQHLRAAILNRERDAPLRLPPEDRLAAHFGVSVMTLRQALRAVRDEGLVTRRPRVGTLIDPAVAPGRAPIALLGTVDTVVAQQAGQRAAVLERGLRRPPPDVAERFPGLDRVGYVRRLRFEGDRPAALAENWLRPADAERIGAAELARWPMTRILTERLGLPIARIGNTLRATLADAELAALLRVPVLSPVLFQLGVSTAPDGTVLDVAHLRFPGETSTFSVTMDMAENSPRTPHPPDGRR